MRPRLALAAVVVVAAGALALHAALHEETRVDRAVGFVPEGAVAYAHISIDRGSDDWRRLERAVDRLPTLKTLRDTALSGVPVGERRINVDRDVRPWLGDEAAVALMPESLVILRAKDPDGARRFLARVTGPGGLAGRLEDGFVVLGAPALVQRALAVHAGRAFSLTHNRSFSRLRDQLPDKRIADVYIANGPAVAPALTALRDFGITTAAASLSIEGGRARIALRGLARTSPGRCGSGGGASLVHDAPKNSAALIEVAHPDCVLRDLLRRPHSLLGRAVARLAGPARALRPLLRGAGELVVTPTREGAAATLVADDVDETRALDVLGRLQPALLRLAGARRLGEVATFQAADADGAPALTAPLSPALQPSYAAFDGKLALSTALSGVAAAHKGGGLGGNDAFRLVLGGLPKRPAAVLFLDLDRLLALGERVGLAQAPAYLAVRDDLQKLGGVGLTFTREGKQTNAELRFKIP